MLWEMSSAAAAVAAIAAIAHSCKYVPPMLGHKKVASQFPLEYDIFDNHTDKTDYYNFIIKSEAYPEKNINIWGWVNNSSNETTQGWLGNNPDFIWKQYKLEENKIQSKCEINPEINTKYVYKIYKSSITTGYDVNLYMM